MPHLSKGHFRKIKPTRFPRMDAEANKKQFPKFEIDLKHLPEARKWPNGKKYYVGLELEKTGMVDTDFRKEAIFDIIGIKVGNKTKKKD